MSARREALCLLACAVLIASRGPLLVTTPRLLGEEASVHLAYAASHGALRSLLLVPTSDYPAGYLNLAPNLALTLAARLFPLEGAAAVATAVAFLVQLVPFAIVLWGRSRFWRTPKRRLLCCFLLLFAPAVHPAVWLSVLNSQVFCGLIAFLILSEDTADISPRRRWAYRLLLVFCGLSGPYASMLLPAFFVKRRLERSPEAAHHLAIVASTAAVQLVVYGMTTTFYDVVPNRLEAPRPAASVVGILVFHVLQPLLGHVVVEPLGWAISSPVMGRGEGLSPATLGLAAAASLVVLAALGLVLVRRRSDPFFRLLPWSLVAVSLATTVLAYGLPRFRYSVFAGLLFLLALLVDAWSAEPGPWRSLCRVLVGVALVAGLATYWFDGTLQVDGTRLSDFGRGPGRPDWPEEVARWRQDPRRALRVWPYSAARSWRTFLPREGEFEEIGDAFARVEGFHLVATGEPSESRVPLAGLPADFKVVVEARNLRPARRARLEVVLEDARGFPVAALPIKVPEDRRPLTVHVTSLDLAARATDDLGEARSFVLRLTNSAPPAPAVVSIDRLEIAPRIEGFFDALLPARILPRGPFAPGVVAANAVLFLALAVLAWRDRRTDGLGGRLFAAGTFFGGAALGFVFLPGSRVVEAFCLFVPVRWWLRGRLDGAGRLVLPVSGALLATAAAAEPAWGLLLLAVAFDLAWRRRWRSLAVLLGAAAVTAAVLVPSSHLLHLAGDAVTATAAAEPEPGFALRAWRLFTARDGLVAGYPFAVLAVLVFLRDPEDRRRSLLLAVLAVLVQWIAWRETGASGPLGSPHFAALAPLFFLLPRRIGSWKAPAVAWLAWLLLTLGLVSAAWTPSADLSSSPVPSWLLAGLVLAAVAVPARLAGAWDDPGVHLARLRDQVRRWLPPESRRAVDVPAVVLALVLAFGFWGFSYDDNFITYRYAKNVLAGEGLVWNPGERVLGTSAPGYALLLAGLAFVTRPLGVDVPHWGTLVALASLVTVIGVVAAAARRGGRAGWTLPAAFAALALTSPLDLHFLGGEAFPVLALVVLAAHALFVQGRGVTAGLLAGAAMCLRLDAGLAALALGLVAWATRRRFPVRFAAAGLAVLAAWLAFLVATFGQIVPNTLAGKTALAEVPYTFRQWQTLTTALPVANAVVFLAGAVLGLVVVGRRGLWRSPPVLALGFWVLGHEVAYRAIGVWFAPWYHLYLWHALLLLFVLATLETASWTAERLRHLLDPRISRAAVSALLLMIVLLPSLAFVTRTWREPPSARYRVNREAAEWVRRWVAPQSEVLAVEIGVFGYFSERRILDLGALVSPRFTAAKLAGDRPRLVAELRPKYILAGPGDALTAEVLAHEGVRGRYEEVTRFSGGTGHLRLLRRHDDSTGSSVSRDPG